MPPKSCRHVSQALRLPDLRRSLRHHDSLRCESCCAPTPRGNSRSKTSRRGRQESLTTNADTAALSASNASLSSSSSSTTSPNAEQDTTLQGWSPSPAWNDLCICITCGFMGCMSQNHFMQHFQTHAKHFVGFLVGPKVFWCCSCRREIDDDSGKTADALQGCVSTFEEIADKQQRRVRSRQLLQWTSQSHADEAMDSQRSYVSDGDTLSSRRGITISDLETANEAAVADAEPTKDQKADDKAPATRSATSVTQQQQTTTPTSVRPAPSPHVASSTDVSLRSMGVLGFSNLGNTCYFNAATQALLTSLHCFPDEIHEEDVIERIATGPIAATLMLLSQSIQRKTSQPFAPPSELKDTESLTRKKGGRSPKTPPKKATSAPVLTVAPLLSAVRKKFSQFRGFHQQDAHELLTSVLWSMDEEMDPPVQNAEEKPEASTDNDGGDAQPQRDDELVNVFVKTDTGETISMRVPPTTTTDELRVMLSKKLQLDDRDVYLQPKIGQRQNVALRRRSSAAAAGESAPARQFSRLNFVRALFGGSLLTQVTCKACGHRSSTAEDAFQLSVPIPEGASAGPLSLKDCLERFTHPTELLVSAKNGYDCDKCSRPQQQQQPQQQSDNSSTAAPSVELRDASMQLCVATLPRVLVVHLKRLSRVKKITQHIQFDAMLDMAPFVRADAGSTLYELVAVVVHKGNKRAGHYVAYVSRQRRSSVRASRAAAGEREEDLDKGDGTERGATLTTTSRSTLLGLEDPDRDWFYVSDSLVQPVGLDQVLKCEAYMLFYQQLPL